MTGKFCVYLTTYLGNKLPRWYIGSTFTSNIYKGYIGSVTSKKYSKLFFDEYALHPELFTVHIWKTYNNRREALAEELRLQKINNVVSSSLFINMAYASVDGFFGMDTSGKNHPRYGQTQTKETRKKIKDNHYDCKGSNNANAKVIYIYSNEGELQFTCHGNFKKICNDNGLPYESFMSKRYKYGKPLFVNSKKNRITKHKYTGWYIINEEEKNGEE